MNRRFYSLMVFLLLATIGLAQEYKLHPVYIYSFTKYVIWPENYATGDFEIVVLGETPLIKELKNMASIKKTPDNRNIVVTKIESPEQIQKCNVLYLPSAKSKLITEVITKIGDRSILLITEEPGMGVKGSNINFIVKDGKLTFEMNKVTMTKQNLRATTELSRMAIQI